MSGFVQVRRDALRALPAPEGRRDGAHLAALVVALLAVLEGDWRTGRIEPWPMVAWARRISMPWRRVRRAADRLAELGHAQFACQRFRAGSIVLDRSRWVHARDRRSERFVQISPQALDAVAAEHDLDWEAMGVLLALVILADDRDWSVRDLTLACLSTELGVGFRSLKAAMGRLAAAGLLRFVPRPGRSCLITVMAGAVLVVGPAGPPMRRGERRQLVRRTRRREGPVWDLAHRIVDRFGVEVPPSVAFVGALEDACTRLDAREVEQRIAAMGSLAQARDPMAVLTGRARRIVDDHDRRRTDIARARARDHEQAAAEAAHRAREEMNWERDRGEDRWLARVLDDRQLEAFLNSFRPGPVRAPMPAVAAAIRVAARLAVAARPDEDPEQVVRTTGPAVVVMDAGAACVDSSEPAAVLPTARDGPTLTERLRSL